MVNIGEKIKSYISWKLFLIFATIILLIISIIFVYNKYLVPKLKKGYKENTEFVEETTDKEVELLMFTVDWCPYCKKALPVWNEFRNEYDGKNINGYTIVFRTINCTDEKDPEVKEMLNKYSIEGYPTIKLIKDNETISYDAKPEIKTLEQFIHTVIS